MKRLTRHTLFSGTTVIALRKSRELVVAVDGVMTTVASDTTPKLKRPICKLHKAARTYFAIVGFLSSETTGFSVSKVAAAACRKGGTVAQISQRFQQSVKLGLYKELATAHEDPELYDEMTHGAPPLEIIFFHVENGAPDTVRSSFYPKFPPETPSFEISTYADNGNDENPSYALLGFNGPANDFLVANPDCLKGNLVEAARKIMDATLRADTKREYVDEPITILRLTESGEQWIERGNC